MDRDPENGTIFRSNVMKVVRPILYSLCISLLLTTASSAQELKPEEIVTKHIDALGKKEVLSQVKTLFALGVSSFEATPGIKGGGKAMVVSDHSNLMWAISLNSKTYPYEKIGYFGDKISLPFVSSGERSLLGIFLNEHPRVLTEGLFGGPMSLRWPLIELSERKSRIKSLGTKKIDGKKAYVLSYSPDGGGADEFTIKLYFDADTFQHVRTEYHREFSSANPKFGQANQLANSEITLTENFADYKNTEGVMLPYTYSVVFSSNANTSSFKTTWGIKVSEYYINQQLAPDFFTFEPKK